MNTKLITALSLCMVVFNAQANPPQPQECPTEAAIKAVGISHSMIDEGDNLWFTGRRDQFYGASAHWTMIIGKIPATTVNEAYNKGVIAMTSLSFVGGPIIAPLGKWVCYYTNDKGYPTIAINPPIAMFDAGHFLNSY